jgi:hypothetical protein
MMDEKFPLGYDVNAYIDKAFEQMKADFPWATREMIAEHTLYGIEKVGGDYQYVAYWNNAEGKREPHPRKTDCEGFLKSLAEGHEWELERANPVKEYINVPAKCTYSCDWYLEFYRIQKHELGGFSAHVQAGNRSAGGSRTFFIPASYLKLPWEEFLDKYLDLIPPGPFYVGRDDLENAPGLKEFLGITE